MGKACSKALPVDRLNATGRHWPFLDARPKMASGNRLQTNLRPVEGVPRPVDTANFFPQNPNGHMLPVAKQTTTG